VSDSAESASSAESAISRLLEVSDAASRTEFLRRHPSLLRTDIVEKLTESVRDKVRLNLGEALRTAETALEIARAIGHPSAVARALRAKANALHFLGQNKAAVSLHAQAAALFESQGDAKELGRTCSASIQPLILLGNYEQALAAARRAQRIFARSGDKLRLARLQINIGNIFHRQDRFPKALACYERAYSQLVPLSDAEGIASSLHNIAVCLISLNDFLKATKTYERARAFCEQHRMPLAVVQADYNIAYLHYLRGEYTLAIKMLQTTREQADQIADAYHAALCRLDLADIYLELNLIEEALGMSQEASLRFQQLAMPYEAAKALTNLAIATGRQGKTRRALELLAEARIAFSRERNGVWPSLIDLYRATILLNKKRYGRSRDLCLKALKSFQNSHLPNRAILCRLTLVRIYLSTNEIEAAHSECVRVLKQLSKIETPFLAQQTYFLAGQVYEARRNSSRAYEAYQSARELLEGLRSHLYSDEAKIAFVQNRLEVYERLVNICRNRPSPASAVEAFRYIEEAKSRNLKEVISQLEPMIPASATKPSEPFRRVQDLRQKLNWCYHRMELEHRSGDQRSLGRCRNLQRLAHKYETELLKRLREGPPSSATASQAYRAASITLPDIREALTPDGALVEFFRVGDQFLAAVITSDRCEIATVASVSAVERLMALLRFQLEKFRLGARYLQPFRKPLLHAAQGHLRELYEGLVAPVRQLLQGRHVVFVPHESLHYLPFHALFDGTRYLIDSYTVSYAPSAGVLVLCSRRLRRRTVARSLVLGVPDTRAPNILSEVQEVSAMLPNAELFIGKSANEEILRERGPSSSFIHIATHAYFRQDNPWFSGIRLGASYLTLLDLCQMNLPAQLIAVSGCATGMSVVAGGDELLGLVRGFLFAGSRSVLLSLWDVHDVTTTLLMKSFYRRLSEGHDQALALQRAMMDLREEYPHPYHWAPFLLVGQGSS
jgi:CHAT domain-containing protein/tetratricopeptide (TPR) repeat protein